MGALATAFELTEGDWTDRFERITVYQRGWRLGGKGASSRGPNGRIEEHGLHVLLGYYDHTFDVMRRCYEALDRERSDPSCPDPHLGRRRRTVEPGRAWWTGTTARGSRGWRAFSPVCRSPRREPAGGTAGSSPLAVADLVVRSLRLLLDFFASLPSPAARRGRLHRLQHLADTRTAARSAGTGRVRWPPSCRARA